MPTLSADELLRLDRDHLWHPYASALTPPTVYPVVSAEGVRLRLADGRELVDGIGSWWAAIHGYNHPALNAAATSQLQSMSHVMFGGLTHEPAAKLARQLAQLTPAGLDRVFFSDSGSVAVEIAIKMAQQYWLARGRAGKHRLLTPLGGYHGDTFMAMSVSDPVAGMHGLFNAVLPQQLFAARPDAPFVTAGPGAAIDSMSEQLERHHEDIAAVILEPIAQCYGGMNFYAPAYLRELRALCDRYDVLLIADEIAVGFGRTGKLFACEHAGIAPDILCLGKGLTGGYLTLAATLCNERVAAGISGGEPGAFMHGPTFMANPLACAVACASVELLISQPWARNVARIERGLRAGLEPARALPAVADVRTLGAIGVIELRAPVPSSVQGALVQRGVWLRPFGNLVYAMPPYVIDDADLALVTAAMVASVAELG